MKLKFFIIILFLFSFIYSVSVTTHQSEKASIRTNSFLDLSGIKAECPYKGAMKNFKVIIDGEKVYYDFVCYSSQIEGSEYDYSVLKTGISSGSMTLSSVDKKLTALSQFKVLCKVDYAVNSFLITVTDKITLTYSCVNVKPITETNELTLSTTSASVSAIDTLEGLTKITVGSQTAESSDMKGVPLRGFQLVVSGNNVSYNYGTLTLKNVESLKSNYLSASAAFRNNNNQKY